MRKVQLIAFVLCVVLGGDMPYRSGNKEMEFALC